MSDVSAGDQARSNGPPQTHDNAPKVDASTPADPRKTTKALEDQSDEERRVRKQEKKRQRDEKNAKFHEKQATRKAKEKTREPVASTSSAPKQSAHSGLEGLEPTAIGSSYQEKLENLKLTDPITISRADMEEIELGERDQPLFEGAHGFQGWAKVRRVPGLDLSNEPTIDDDCEPLPCSTLWFITP